MSCNILSKYFHKTFNYLINQNICVNQSKQTNICYQKFYPNSSLNNILFKKSLIVFITIFGSKYLINNKKVNELNTYFCKSIKRIDLLSIFNLKRAKLLSKTDLNEEKNELSSSKRFNFIADVTEKVSSSVVFIEVMGKHPFFNLNISVSNGSGFIVDSSGLILTNAHVVGNYSEVSVKLFDGRVVTGKVEYVDHRLDLATLSIDLKEKLPFIKLGESDKSRTGEWVIALGSPFCLSNTITVGVISSVNRKSQELGINSNEIDYIQTDAVINIGNSGGPLVNLDGEAIGINSMKVTAGISFAIPSNYAKEFIQRAKQFRQKTQKDKIQEKTSKKNRYIGISMLTLTPEIIQQFRLKEEDFPDVKNGILIWSVVMGSPAHMEGLRPRDIITRINGMPAKSANDIYKVLESEQTLNLTVRRNDRDINIVVKPRID